MKYKGNLQQLVKINEVRNKKENFCKIGDTSVISETIYASGYEVDPEQLEEDEAYLLQVFICDNPGFADTRGKVYEVCTYYSMDETIENCARLNSILLIVSYEALYTNKSSSLLSSIDELSKFFP